MPDPASQTHRDVMNVPKHWTLSGLKYKRATEYSLRLIGRPTVYLMVTQDDGGCENDSFNVPWTKITRSV